MKKMVLNILAVSLLLLPNVSCAQISLQKAGITPDNPFYFFDTLYEKIVLWLTIKPENKITLRLKYAEERIAEIDKLASQNKSQYINKAVKNFEANMKEAQALLQKLQSQGKDTTSLVIKLEENTLKQQNILHKVLTQVPERVKYTIQNAMNISKQSLEQATEFIQKKSQKKPGR